MKVTKALSELDERKLAGLRYALGDIVMRALDDPNVIEVRLNDDGRLWVETHSEKKHAGHIDKNNAIAILNQVSSALNGELSKENPSVSGELPFNGERFHGVAMPVSDPPIFAIRKKPLKIFDLDDYVRKGVITFKQAEQIRRGILERLNFMIVGATKTGKTTFANAILNEIGKLLPNTRMLIVEDTKELQCTLSDRTYLRSSEWTNMAQIGSWILRLSPDSITVGEVREGGPALALLKNWNTGHPGGLMTIHADSEDEGLIRLDQLIQEVSMHPQRELIGRAVNVVVYLENGPQGRKCKGLIRVRGYDASTGKFLVEPVI